MEQNNKDKILKNRPNLIEMTVCSNTFLAIFTSKGIFSKIDDERIKVEKRNDGDLEAADKFYDLIVTKTGSFEVLLHALRETKQTGALNLLNVKNDDENIRLEKASLKFVESPDYIRKFSYQNDENILVVVSEDCEITCDWILETTQNSKLFKKDNVDKLESLNTDFIAVVNVGKCLDTLYFIAKNYKKRAVLVANTSPHNKILVDLNKPINKCKIVRDNIQWIHLSLAEKDKILKGLKESLNIDGIYLTDELEQIDTKLLYSLIRGRFPLPHELFLETIPDPIKYYIPRTILTRNVVSKNIFKSSLDSTPIQDILLFTHIEHHVLSKLAGKQLTDTSGNLLKSRNVTTPFVILEHLNHFLDICELFSDKFVHHLRYNGNNFIWIKSNKNVSKIQKFVDKKQCDIIETKFLLEVSNQQQKSPICISDTAGMGKSILLVHLATKLKQLHTDGIVAFAVISELIKSIQIKSHGNSLRSALTLAIFEHVSISKLGHAYLKDNSEYIRELFLDGLDEIDADELEFALNCITEISSIFKETKLWITTRPHVLHTLENKLGVLGYTLAPFNKNDQVNFLTSFWSSGIKNPKVLHTIRKYATLCLKKLKSALNFSGRESNVWENDIAGVPLQCFLIAKIYEEDIKFCFQNNPTENAFANDDIQSIPDLYTKMINTKFTSFRMRYDRTHIEKSEIENAHIKLSLEYLYPSHTCEHLQNLKHNLSMQQIFDVGIVEGSTVLSTPRFIHRTFAEYFFAAYVSKQIFKLKTKQFWEFLFVDLLKTEPDLCYIKELELPTFTFQHSVITCFLNAFLGKHKPQIEEKLEKFECLNDTTEILKAALHHNFENIFDLFIHRLSGCEQSIKQFLNEDTLFCAVYYANIPVLKTVVSKYITLNDTPLTNLKQIMYFEPEDIYDSCDEGTEETLTLLHVSVLREDFLRVEFLVENYFHDSLLENDGGIYDNLLHICVEETYNNSKSKLKSRLNIMKALANVNPSLLIGVNRNNEYPISCDNVHQILLREICKAAGTLYQKRMIVWKIVKTFASKFTPELMPDVKIIFDNIGQYAFAETCNSRIHSRSLLWEVIKVCDNIELLDYLRTFSESFCRVDDKMDVIKMALETNACGDCILWLIKHVGYEKEELRDIVSYSISEERWFRIGILLEHLKNCSFIIDDNFGDVISFVFNKVCVRSSILVEIAIKLQKYFLVRNQKSELLQWSMFPRNCPIFSSNDMLFDVVLKSDELVKESLTLFDSLVVRKLITNIESCFLKCVWVCYLSFNSRPYNDKYMDYLYFHESRYEGNTINKLLQIAAAHFGDFKIHTNLLPLIIDTEIKVNLFWDLIYHIWHKTPLDFWEHFVRTCKLQIDRTIDSTISPFCLPTPPVKLETCVIDLLKSQFPFLRKNESVILNIQRIFYAVVKNHTLDVIKTVCELFTRSCTSKTMSFSKVIVFFNRTAHTLLDAAIESLKWDVLEYVYTVLTCKISFLKSVPDSVHKCLLDKNIESNSKIKYIQVLATIFPIKINDFLNQLVNDDGITPLSFPLDDNKLVSVLVQNGADVNSRDINGNTPLHHAFLRNADESLVMELIRCGANVKAQNNNQQTPLIVLVHKWNVRSFRYKNFMNKFSSKLTKVDKYGSTYIHSLAKKISSDAEFQQFIELLKSWNKLNLLILQNHLNETPVQLVQANINISLQTKRVLKAHGIHLLMI